MRAISLHQPWATAVALGAKKIETRHWQTPYSGPIAVHAAKKWDFELRQFARTGPMGAMLRHFGIDPDDLPRGKVVAVAYLTVCIPSDALTKAAVLDEDHGGWTERDMGNYDAGRFGWIFQGVRPLKNPIPYRGGQSFFQVPDELIVAELSGYTCEHEDCWRAATLDARVRDTEGEVHRTYACGDAHLPSDIHLHDHTITEIAS